MKTQAWLDYGNDPVLVPCQTIDVSQTGARLALPDNGDVPNEFDLLFSTSRGAKRRCRIVWRTDREVGVVFI